MAVNYKKIVSLSAIFGAVVFEGLRIVKDGFRGLERDRRKRKEKEIRDAEWEERQAQREAERKRKQEEWEEKRSKREDDMPDGDFETVEINGIMHYKNRYGNWCPLINKSKGDIKITVTSKNIEE